MKRLSLLLFLIIISVSGFFVWWNNGNAPANRLDKSQKIFVIDRGAPIREIGNNLKKEGLIRDPVIFFLYIKYVGRDKSIQAGDYRLSPAMNLATVVENLRHGTLDKWVVFPEGMRSEEYAEILKLQIETYEPSWEGQLKAREGYLFPDTYLIPKDSSIDSVLSIIQNNFNKKIEELGFSQSSPDLPKIVILASLIEREANGAAQMPIIAGILTNRLNRGMALDVDATVQYAKGYSLSKKTWWPQITAADYRGVISPYNTYLEPDLPPGPISNPGIDALRAAANPQKNNFFFYLHDADGQLYTARTIEEHNRNIEKYLK